MKHRFWTFNTVPRTWMVWCVGGIMWAAALTPTALAQQASDVPAALQPGLESLIVRSRAFYFNFDDPDNDAEGLGSVDQWVYTTSAAYGVSPDLTLVAEVPVVYRNTSGQDDDPDLDGVGLADISLSAQWRLSVDDPAPVTTRRVVLITGVEVPTFDPGFSSESFDPFIGLSATWITDRHTFNAGTVWRFNTGSSDDRPIGLGSSSSDFLTLDGAYLYRIDPPAYTADSKTSTFLQAQLLGRYETRGDFELVFSPGISHNGSDWLIEAAVQIPVFQDLDDRAELEWGVNIGFRLLF